MVNGHRRPGTAARLDGKHLTRVPEGVVVSLLLLLGCVEPASEPAPPDGREVLRRAVAAMAAARTFEYDFEFGGPDDPYGHVTGHTLLQRVHDARDGWIRVRGEVHAQPRFEREAQRFDYGLDAERARLADLGAGTWAEAPARGPRRREGRGPMRWAPTRLTGS